MTALTAISPELVLVDPDLAAALRATAVAGRRVEPRVGATAPSPPEGVSLLRRVTVAAGAAVLAVLLLEAGAGSAERQPLAPPVRRSAPAPAEHRVPAIASGRTDAFGRPAPRLVPPDRAVRAVPAGVSWPAVRGAAYYDLVLWRDGRRVLDRWPREPRLALPTLAPGHYLWFAYPGFGPRAAGRFGPLAGSGTVAVPTTENR